MTTITVDVRPDAADEPAAVPDPRWARPGLLALLAGTAVLYLWGLGSSGWANSFYAAAAQAGTQSWKAWLFGSLDAGNAITVDKPPAAMWVMSLSGRLFGFNAFTMLLPQALMGVAAVAVLYFTVKRSSGPGAGLIAGAVLALTPVATLMFRYNNPDALLVLLLVVAAYCTVRAIENGSTRWMALTGCVVGFAFLTKMLQAFLIVPGLALAFLVAAPIGLWKRLGALLVGGVTMVVSAGWYVALVSLWPADSRPYIAGSTDNSLLQLALGYNGIQRIVGGGGPGGGGGGPGGGGPGGGGNVFFGGEPGIGRMFGLSFGTESSWLLPAAIIGLLAGLWLTWRTARTGQVRASLLLWGGWLLVTGAVFSFMDGTVHPYYTVALAPAIAALVGISVAELLRRKDTWPARLTLATMLAVTGVWAFVLLNRTPDWWPALRWVVLFGSVIVAAVVAVGLHRLGRATVVVAVAAALFGLGATAAYSIETMSSVHDGPVSTSGPAKQDGFGGGGPGGQGPGGRGGDNAALEAMVQDTDNRWAAAAIGSHTIDQLELKTGTSLMAIGGFSGGDPSPTLAQFQQDVADGQVRYFIAGNDKEGGPMNHRTGVANDITTWVEQHFTKMDVGGTTVYDLQPHA
ncbi:glycosyltransferase family 39 protein [Mycobacterium sp. AZCC_0083]|uniref:glycosyltransferase family 39 protein n=1 Tax=Mycobacterium sp. AZCC_0083 TaxID=2735882 RepID=UPI0016183BFC|nr:glycosyltransferase family 39 protein [Mycobacterium sp. AZCC_0083]MBB5166231.1 4-amino-4-deoxy-L-arabinose transferase-like glycosyltransferase [Mycobacterium sp. AZCC_0083]